ncbi:hypothetical protein HG1285_09051, partial [Hydrogenivirga sp. 128-5-R1-1]
EYLQRYEALRQISPHKRKLNEVPLHINQQAKLKKYLVLKMQLQQLSLHLFLNLH